MIRTWLSKLWHRDGLPKAVNIPPRPNVATQSELDMVYGIKPMPMDRGATLKPSQQPISELIDNASSRHYDLHKARTCVSIPEEGIYKPYAQPYTDIDVYKKQAMFL